MERIPSQVLSECFQEHMTGHRLIAAVFLTYQFDPAFFEEEILPVFIDLPLSHAAPVRLIQLEDALRELGGRIAVYYDAGGLAPTGGAANGMPLNARTPGEVSTALPTRPESSITGSLKLAPPHAASVESKTKVPARPAMLRALIATSPLGRARNVT